MAIRVNGERIDDMAIHREAQALAQIHGCAAIDDRLLQQARDFLIGQTLLRQEALQDERPVDPKIIKDLTSRFPNEGPDQLEQRVRIQRYIDDASAKAPRPSRKDVEAFYRQNPQAFAVGETVRVKHIVKNVESKEQRAQARAAIEAAEAKIDAGVPFEEVADEFSDCAGTGGDLGYFERGAMVPQFERVVFQMMEGEVSAIFETPFGFHIAKLIDRKPPRMRPLPEVRGEIEERLLAQAREQLLQQRITELRAKATVQEEA